MYTTSDFRTQNKSPEDKSLLPSFHSANTRKSFAQMQAIRLCLCASWAVGHSKETKLHAKKYRRDDAIFSDDSRCPKLYGWDVRCSARQNNDAEKKKKRTRIGFARQPPAPLCPRTPDGWMGGERILCPGELCQRVCFMHEFREATTKRIRNDR